MLPVIVAVAAASVCLVTDLLWRRIPNIVTLTTAAAGLVLGVVNDGWRGLAMSAGGMAVGFVTLILPYYVGGMGAGDVKLMAALGALMGPSPIVHIFLYTALIGGVIAVVNAIWRGTLMQALRNIRDWTTALWLQRMAGLKGGLTQTELSKTAGVIPYGVAIALGLGAYLVFGKIVDRW
jgi:prepilin peptidase CpaA